MCYIQYLSSLLNDYNGCYAKIMTKSIKELQST